MKRQYPTQREGKIVVMTAVLLPIIFGMAAFGIDVGHIAYSHSRLQTAAESAALAAVAELPDSTNAVSKAQNFGQLNFAGTYPNVVASQDVEFGTWAEDGTFTTTPVVDANAVRVTAKLSDDNNNSLALYFGQILGTSHSNLSASAIAARPESTGGIGTRFLIDEDMIDKDMQDIEDLAIYLGRDAEELVTARGFNLGKSYGASNWTWEDNFLDIPAGEELTLPTGQGENYDNNDAGLFDINHSSFPFTSTQAFEDFLFYSETGNDSSKWGSDTSYILNQLDPLEGVEPVTDDSLYDSFVDPSFVHVSPVFPSDISTLNKAGNVPQVNAKGLRRGLLAYKIIEVGQDIDGNGTVLPELVIEVVDPSTISLGDIDNPGTGYGSGGGGSSSNRIVQ